MKAALRKLLIYGHRYLGMALSLLFLMWFLTGIGMIYSRGMPRLTPETRLARMAPIDLDAVRFTPIEAVSKAGLIGPGGQTTLLTVLDRPAYRYDGRGTDIVFADTGERFVELELEDAIRIAARFVDVPEERVRYDTLLTESDQWTMTQGRQLPMYKLRVDDEAGSQVYVSARLGEVVQFTTRRGRALSWISVIPHFMYFKALRMNADLWLGIMTWVPVLASRSHCWVSCSVSSISGRSVRSGSRASHPAARTGAGSDGTTRPAWCSASSRWRSSSAGSCRWSPGSGTCATSASRTARARRSHPARATLKTTLPSMPRRGGAPWAAPKSRKSRSRASSASRTRGARRAPGAGGRGLARRRAPALLRRT